MECNKDEAIRAKDIAKEKMENKDYKGARKFVIKSHKLYPNLDNLQQMIMLCNVHCSAEEKLNENERNWYKILNCKETDESAVIKRQYRKLALMLHPDKNRFPGAVDAFQLISEAYSVLADYEKRMSFDRKFVFIDSDSDSDSEEWVDFAKIVAEDVADQAGNSSRLYEVEIDHYVGGSKRNRSPAKKFESVEKTRDNEVETDHALRRPKRGRPSKCGRSPAKKFESTEKMRDALAKDDEVGIGNASRRPKRGRPSKKFDAMERNTSDVDNNTKGIEKGKERLDTRMDDNVKMHTKIAAKEKEKVSASTEDNGISPKTCNIRTNSSFGVKMETRVIEYPKSKFYDFDKERAKNRFSVGQIWAAYDTLDVLPRFYAKIDNVVSQNFKLMITWLEPESGNWDEIKWISEGLPTSCGKFRPGSSEVIEDHLIFSHMVSWKKSVKRGCGYEIYPRKGEIWALFKNWDIKWYRDLESHKEWEFDFVKILSDYHNNVGVYIGFLCKVNGFTSLFTQMDDEMNRILIPVRDIFRFSHRIPSFQMTRNEGSNVPQMCFELDSASLPAKFLS